MYRLPRATSGSGTAGSAPQPITLELIAELAPQPSLTEEHVTAATATPDGRWIVLRTRTELRFHPASRLLAADTGGALTWDARGLGHPQGESVAIADDGTAWLTSEAEDGGDPRFARIACTLP